MNEIIYDKSFMNYTAAGSNYSAQRVSNLVAGKLRIESVLDVGCALGTWLKCWREAGVGDVKGVDGDYVSKSDIVIDEDDFSSFNISEPFDLDRKFDLVQSLEVGEHISPEKSDVFIENITRHASKFILLSTAPPGQGGENHINEQPYSFWKTRLEAKDYVCYDCIRPVIANDKAIKYWYRYNTFLYTHASATSELPEEWASNLIAPGTDPSDISPPWFKIRKMAINLLPNKTQDFVARMKSKLGA